MKHFIFVHLRGGSVQCVECYNSPTESPFCQVDADEVVHIQAKARRYVDADEIRERATCSETGELALNIPDLTVTKAARVTP